MRTGHYNSEFHEAKTRKEAVEIMGDWAEVIKKVEGGYMGFETQEDYDTWRKQK